MMSLKNAPVSAAGVTLGLTPMTSTPQEDEETKRRKEAQLKLSRPNLPATNTLFGEGL